ncbi:MAG: SDR family NAD(P)-dependent oxidoreductase [Rickettsiales bacterium]
MQKFLITGTSSGIGFYLAKQIAIKNKVIGLARTNQFAHKNFTYINVDLSSITNSTNIAKALAKQQEDIDIIIVNAGFGMFKELEQFSGAQIIELFNVNIISQIILLKYLLPNLRKRKNAKIIFMGSETALLGAKKATIYAATKFALRGFAQSLRAEVKKDNVAVTIINPGIVASDFYKNLAFTYVDEQENKINIEDIFALINLICQLDNNLVIDEINLTPMKKNIRYKK